MSYRHLYSHRIIYTKNELRTNEIFDANHAYRKDGPAEIYFDGYLRWSDGRINNSLCFDAYISNHGAFRFCLEKNNTYYYHNGIKGS